MKTICALVLALALTAPSLARADGVLDAPPSKGDGPLTFTGEF